ncbi:MAG: hypothetical protein AAFS06_22745, partial [Cyanobacteria bacterium J06631_12]
FFTTWAPLLPFCCLRVWMSLAWLGSGSEKQHLLKTKSEAEPSLQEQTKYVVFSYSHITKVIFGFT